MIEYINAGNIDDRVLNRTANLLQRGGLVGLPTDTSWVIACSLNSKEGIKRLRRLSAERDERHFTLLCADISQIGDYCSMDNTRFRLIKRLTPGPYVLYSIPFWAPKRPWISGGGKSALVSPTIRCPWSSFGPWPPPSIRSPPRKP